jgi:hypothetical protein
MGAKKTWQFVGYILFYLGFLTVFCSIIFFQKTSTLVFIFMLAGICADLILLVVNGLLLFNHIKKSRNS